MRYSIEQRNRIYLKGYRYSSFVKNMGKNLSNKYGQKRLDSAKKSKTDAIKTASKRAIQKIAEEKLLQVKEITIQLVVYQITLISKIITK